MSKMFQKMAGMGDLLKQAQKAMADSKQVESQLESMRIDGASPGGYVKISVNGNCCVLDVKIAKDVVDPDDVEALEDLVKAAFVDAVTKANATKQEELQKIIPGGLGGMF